MQNSESYPVTFEWYIFIPVTRMVCYITIMVLKRQEKEEITYDMQINDKHPWEAVKKAFSDLLSIANFGCFYQCDQASTWNMFMLILILNIF